MTTNTPWVENLSETPLSERTAVIQALVVAEFKASLLIAETDELPFDESYFELGLTSLGATEIKQRLEARLGRPFDSAILFGNPTINHLLNYLRTGVLADFFVSKPGMRDTSTPPDRAAAPASAPSNERRSPPQDLVNDILRDLYQT